MNCRNTYAGNRADEILVLFSLLTADIVYAMYTEESPGSGPIYVVFVELALADLSL